MLVSDIRGENLRNKWISKLRDAYIYVPAGSTDLWNGVNFRE